MNNEMLEAALEYAARGWRVFPCNRDKSPALGKGGHHLASVDAEKITAWWTKWPNAPIGYNPGAEGVIIDCDVKDGKDGIATLARIAKRRDPLPATLTVMTPAEKGEGRQYHFKIPTGTKIRGRLGGKDDGIELKGAENGYGLLPPSRHPNGGTYAWAPTCGPDDGQEAAELPAAWLEEIRAPERKPTGNPTATSRAICPPGEPERTIARYIRDAQLNGNRNRTGYDLAQQLFWGGIPIEETLALAGRYVAAVPQAKDPYTASEFEESARQAYQSEPRESPWPEEAAANPLPGKVFSWSEMAAADVPPIEGFLSGNLFSRGNVCLIAGRRAAGKTYVGLDLARHIAAGTPFGPMETKRGTVLFISLEMGFAAISRRVKKLTLGMDTNEFGRGVSVACKVPVNLDSNTGADQLREFVERTGTPDVVFLDSLRDAKGATTENDNDDMSRVMVRLRDRVAEALDCCLIVLHHQGKQPADGSDRGGRGASSIEDVCADVLILTVLKGGNRSGRFTKTRDGEEAAFTYRLEGGLMGDRLIVKVEGGDAEEIERLVHARKLADYIGRKEAVTVAEIMAHFEWGRSVADRRLDQAKEEGWIKEADAKRGKAVLYVPKHKPVWVDGRPQLQLVESAPVSDEARKELDALETAWGA